MKRLFTFIALSFLTFSTFAATITWDATKTGVQNWRDVANWVGGIIPVSGDEVIFDGAFSANITMAAGSSINDYRFANLEVKNGADVTLVSSHASTIVGITVTKFSIAINSKLKYDGATASGTNFKFYVDGAAAAGICTVNGTLSLGGLSATNQSINWNNTGSLINVESGGHVELANGGLAAFTSPTAVRLIFKSGSFLDYKRNGGSPPIADYQLGSLINITGVTTTFGGLNSSGTTYNGGLLWDCTSQTAAEASTLLIISSGSATFNYGGTITIKNTGMGSVRLTTYSNVTQSAPNSMGDIVVDGGSITLVSPTSLGAGNINLKSLTINGGTAVVGGILAGTSSSATVLNNYSQTGGTLNISANTSQTSLKVNGSFSQTAGAIQRTGANANTRIELIGSSLQSVTLGGTQTLISTLMVNNTGNAKLTANGTWDGNVAFNAGKLILDNVKLSVGGTANGTATGGWMVTQNGGSLTVKNVLDAIGKRFPVSDNLTTYSYVYLTPNGANADVNVKCDAGVTPAGTLDATKCYKKTINVTIESGAPTSSNVEYGFMTADAGVNVSGTNFIAYRYNGTAWAQAPGTMSGTVLGSPQFGANVSILFNGQTAFSPQVVGMDVALSVELKKINAYGKGRTNMIEWSTATEKNMKEYSADPHTKKFIDLATETVFGALWARDSLDYKTRALICVITDATMGRHAELDIHLRFALKEGWTEDELIEVLLHMSGYVGVPLIREAIYCAKDVFADERKKAKKAKK